MSDYSKSTDFAAKDDLPSGNANKVVSGTEINTEFEAIQTAVNSKADTASPTFTGTVTIPTIDANAGAIDGTTIGASSASTGAFTTITGTTITASTGFVGALTGNVTGNITGTAPAGTLTGATLASNVLSSSLTSLGTIASLVATTADINGGTIDGTTIGASSASTGAFTTLTASTGYTGAVDGIVGGTTPAAGTFTSVAIGSSPATAGAIRLENNQPINARNAADSANVNLLYLNASDDAVIGVDLTVPNNDCIVGGTSAGAASAATLYADGSIWALSNTSQKLTVGNDDYVSNTTGTTLDISVGATTGNTYTELRSLQDGRNSWGDLVLQRGGGSVIVGGTSAGATSAVTAYADGSLKASTGSSGASIPALADEAVVEGSGSQVGMTMALPDASTGYFVFANPSAISAAGFSWNHDNDEMQIFTDKAGAELKLLGDDEVTNLTLSGASGNIDAEFEGSITLQNTEAIRAKDSGGTARNIIDTNSGDDLLIGNANLDTLALYAGTSNPMIFNAGAVELGRFDTSANLVVGNTTAGATSAATLYATGAGKFSTGSSGATASPAADEFVVESSATGGISILTPDASTGYLIFGSPSDSGGPRLSYSYNSAEFVVGTGTAGHSTILKGDDRVTNLTLSGASGSELLTAAGSVKVTDFLKIVEGSELTVASGVVTVTSSHHTIDTEGDAASDDLNTINGATNGDFLVLRSVSGARETTLKDGTGNLLMNGDFTLTSGHDIIMFLRVGSNWQELTRSDNLT